MKRFCLFCLCLLGFSVWGASDQVVEKVLDIFEADSLPGSNVAVTADSDSVHLSTVKKELAAARLNEANLRMEIEQIKLRIKSEIWKSWAKILIGRRFRQYPQKV